MAVDDSLLESTADSRTPTLRFYEWSAPTLSLGYFQKYADRWSHLESRDAACVRRASGGGAILHDQELTYSYCVPTADPRSSSVTGLFDLFHRALIRTLENLGVTATICGNPQKSGGDAPFLCFERRSSVDVIIDGYKVCGSAQRRGRGAVLQHGSILLARSEKAPQLPGIADLASTRISPSELQKAWLWELSNALTMNFEVGPLTKAESAKAVEIERERFAAVTWTEKK
ncbi:lipoate--protein ligase family protein [Blastopirellula sp. J2-11]|uniref:lipoate--protein ligase family protein n=1 Tax=Blastopirellula sp. J2-11 TaxID=2943192 RepID=UPI0021C8999D|nr:biotin/lipoate A/B protein ligase family protein [Blastopirellula sp. J2-11]UUO07538.1 lipoate--protein ligase family protein [Blastopirellula sp. J2-11]